MASSPPVKILKISGDLEKKQNNDLIPKEHLVCVICSGAAISVAKGGRRCLNTSLNLLDELFQINPKFRSFFNQFQNEKTTLFYTCIACASFLIKNIRKRKRIVDLQTQLTQGNNSLKIKNDNFITSYPKEENVYREHVTSGLPTPGSPDTAEIPRSSDRPTLSWFVVDGAKPIAPAQPTKYPVSLFAHNTVVNHSLMAVRSDTAFAPTPAQHTEPSPPVIMGGLTHTLCSDAADKSNIHKPECINGFKSAHKTAVKNPSIPFIAPTSVQPTQAPSTGTSVLFPLTMDICAPTSCSDAGNENDVNIKTEPEWTNRSELVFPTNVKDSFPGATATVNCTSSDLVITDITSLASKLEPPTESSVSLPVTMNMCESVSCSHSGTRPDNINIKDESEWTNRSESTDNTGVNDSGLAIRSATSVMTMLQPSEPTVSFLDRPNIKAEPGWTNILESQHNTDVNNSFTGATVGVNGTASDSVISDITSLASRLEPPTEPSISLPVTMNMCESASCSHSGTRSDNINIKNESEWTNRSESTDNTGGNDSGLAIRSGASVVTMPQPTEPTVSLLDRPNIKTEPEWTNILESQHNTDVKNSFTGATVSDTVCVNGTATDTMITLSSVADGTMTWAA